MRVGLTLSGDNLNADGARFAAHLGVTDVVVHLNNCTNALDPSDYTERGQVGPILGEVIDEPFWGYDRMRGVAGRRAQPTRCTRAVNEIRHGRVGTAT